MARQRLIKPDFFQHEELHRAEMVSALPCRLAFAGLWTQCDRRGLFEWKPVKLKLNILPFDEVDFGDVLDALEREGFVWSYVVDGKRYGCIPSFGKHQTFNINEKADKKIPEPPSVRPEPVPTLCRDGAGTNTAQCANGASTPGTGTGTGTGTAAGTGLTRERGTKSAAAAARNESGEGDARALAIAANQAITLRFGEQPSPIIASHLASHELATTLREAGIPVSFGAQVIADVVARTQFKRPPRSLGYFRAAIVEAWEADAAHRQARSAPPALGNGTPGVPVAVEYSPEHLARRAQFFHWLTFGERQWAWHPATTREQDMGYLRQKGYVPDEAVFLAEWQVIKPLIAEDRLEALSALSREAIETQFRAALAAAVAGGTLGTTPALEGAA